MDSYDELMVQLLMKEGANDASAGSVLAFVADAYYSSLECT